ncbi:MAG: hypothetical protein JNJ95_04380 [Dechloromonas sp.]|nr:hypothetical protein [Dechloromonas sp.]
MIGVWGVVAVQQIVAQGVHITADVVMPCALILRANCSFKAPIDNPVRLESGTGRSGVKWRADQGAKLPA